MSEEFKDAIEEIEQVLADRSSVYLGAQHDEVLALGHDLALASGGHPKVAQELGYLASLMALEPDAFYDAAELRIKTLRQAADELSQLLVKIFEGPDGILRWSPSSLGTRQIIDAQRLRTLLETIRKARYARSEVTEEVHADLLSKARLAQEELSKLRQLSADRAATVATTEALANFREKVNALEVSLEELLTLEGAWGEVGWREFALRRLLEYFDADVTRDLLGLDRLPAPDAPLNTAIAHVTLAMEIMEKLESVNTPFGQLLAPSVALTPKEATKTRDVRLRPIPERIKGRRTFPGKWTSSQVLETCVTDPATWDHPTWFEQRVQMIQSRQASGWLDVGATVPLHDILLETEVISLLRNNDGSEHAVHIAHHALVDHTTGTNYSLEYASGLRPLAPPPTNPGSFNLLLADDASGPPTVGTFYRYGAQGGPRLRVDAVGAAPVSLGAIPGTWREVLISDPFGDIAGGLGSFLSLAAIAKVAPAAFAELSLAVGLNFNNFPVDSLDVVDPVVEGVKAAFELDDPYKGYYSSLYDVPGTQKNVLTLGFAPDHPAHAIFTTGWLPGSPYIDAGWTAKGVLFRDSGWWGKTHTLKIDVPWSIGVKTTFAEALRKSRVRLVDPTGVTPTEEVTIRRVRVIDTALLQSDADFYAVGDLVVELEDEVARGVDWILQMQEIQAGLSGRVSGFKLTATSPWRGWTDLALDVAPGDLLYLSDGQRCVVWVTSGGRVRVVPPLQVTGPDQTIEAYRVRYIIPGDRVVALSDTDGQQGAWKVSSISYAGGIVLRELSGLATTLSQVVDNYITTLAVVPDVTTTHRFEVIESDTTDLVDLENQERIFREQLSREVVFDPGTLQPVRWYLRLAGRPENVSVVNRTEVVARSFSRPMPSLPVPAQFAVRVISDGYSGNLELIENWVDEEGNPLGEYPAGGSRVYDLVRYQQGTIESLSLPAAPSTVPVRTLTQLRGTLTGPLVSGGTVSFAPWALTLYRLERRLLPDLDELFQDIGRARATVGQPRATLVGQTGLTLVLNPDRRGGVLTVVDPPDVPVVIASPTQERLEGCDVVFSTGDEPDPPIRIQTAEIDSGDPLTATVTFSRTVPESLSGTVTLYESTLSQAWREIQVYRTYLDLVKTWLSYLPDRASNRLVMTATRLRKDGFRKIAQAILDCEFDKWVDPAWAGADAQDLVDKLEAVMTSLSRQRQLPVEGGE